MRTDDAINRSIFIITEYYENRLEPFFDAISDDVLWIGPAKGQMIRGRQNLIDTFAAEEHDLTFTMGSIRAVAVSPSNHVKEIVLRYDIQTHFPSGSTLMHDQRLHYTWRDRRVATETGWTWRPEIAMLHISNAWSYDPNDTIYPVHFENVPQARLAVRPEGYVTLKAVDGSVHRLAADRILYIETVKRAARLIVHTVDDVIVTTGTLPGIEERYPDLFLRTHASYLVNPDRVRGIRRFAVTLSDGTELPVPEKKYTKVKRQLMQGSD